MITFTKQEIKDLQATTTKEVFTDSHSGLIKMRPIGGYSNKVIKAVYDKDVMVAYGMTNNPSPMVRFKIEG